MNLNTEQPENHNKNVQQEKLISPRLEKENNQDSGSKKSSNKDRKINSENPKLKSSFIEVEKSLDYQLEAKKDLFHSKFEKNDEDDQLYQKN